MTTAFTVVDPTSIPIKNCWSMLLKAPLGSLVRRRLHLLCNMMHEAGCSADDALGVRHMVQRPLRFRMRLYPGAALIQRQAGLFQGLGEFFLGLVLGLAQ